MRTLLNISLIILSTCGLLSQNEILGTYQSSWGSKLTLADDKKFDYESFECYHLVTASGTWVYKNDTLYLTTTSSRFDSILAIKHSKIDVKGIRITIEDMENNLAYHTIITAFFNETSIIASTDTLGYIDVDLSNIDSLKIGNGPIIKSDNNYKKQNHIILSYNNVDFLSIETFNNSPFLVKRKKIYFVYKNGISKKNYFKKE